MTDEPVRRFWYWRNEKGRRLTGELYITDEEALERKERGHNIWPSEGEDQLRDKLLAELKENETE